MKEITVVSENKVGVLANIARILGGSGVNIDGISAQGEEGKGVVRFVTNDVTTAERELKRHGYQVRIEDVLILKMDDRPGELAKVAERLAHASVSLESVYLLGKHKGIAEVAVKPAKYMEKAKTVLEKTYDII